MLEIDVIATAASIIGAILTASGKPSWMPASLTVYIIGSVFWGIYAFQTNQMPLLVLNVVFILIEGWGLYKWRKLK